MKRKIIISVLALCGLIIAIAAVSLMGNQSNSPVNGEENNSDTVSNGISSDIYDNNEISVSSNPSLFAIKGTVEPGKSGNVLGEEIYLSGGLSIDLLSDAIKSKYKLTIPGVIDGQNVWSFTISDDNNVTFINSDNGPSEINIFECNSLEEIILPSSVYTIGILNCRNLKIIDMSNCSELCEIMCMDGLNSLEKLVLPEGVKFAGMCHFCGSLKEVYLPNTLVKLQGSFISCTELETLDIPDSVTIIESECFTNCPKLTLIVGHDTAAEKYAIENDIPYTYRE